VNDASLQPNGASNAADNSSTLADARSMAAPTAEADPHANPHSIVRENPRDDSFESDDRGLHLIGPGGEISRTNHSMLETLGYIFDEVAGHDVAEFLTSAATAAAMMETLRRGQELHQFPAEVRCRDGSSRFFLIDSSSRLDHGRLVDARLSARDVTDQNRAAEAASLLAAIVDSSHDAIVSKDLTGRITSWNASAERMFGYTAGEAVGRSIRMIIPADRQSEEDEVLRRIHLGERVEHFETVRVRKDGTTINVSLTISPVRNSAGTIVGASKVARDITEQKEAEEAIRRSLAAKDDFLGLVSHELRTPITTLKGTANVLRRHGDRINEADRRQALVDIERGADQLLRIVENMLMLARSDSMPPDEFEPLLVSRVVAQLVDEQREQFPGNPIKVTTVGGILPVMASDGYVRLIVGNLLSNARKYSAPGSAIDITIERTPEYARISVSDRGIGLREDQLEAVFTPFFRAPAATAHAAGVGLGLTVCKRLVEIQGGSIHAERRPGGGTTFSFTLLRAEDPAAGQAGDECADSQPVTAVS